MDETQQAGSCSVDNKSSKEICSASKNSNEDTYVDDKIEPVLDETITKDLPIIKVYVATIMDLKNTSKYIQGINVCLPFSNLQHLKRIKNKDIIICPVDFDGGYPEKLLKDKGFDGLSSPRVIEVTSTFPRTRKQFDRANKLWPVKQFHEDKDLEKKLAGTYFSSDEKLTHEKFMRVAIEAAERSKVKIGSVVVDPVKNEIIAIAGDHRLSHPLKHTTMVAIDLVARSQCGGAWDVEPCDYFRSSDIDDKNFAHKKRNRELNSDDVLDGPYLCTGYDIYITCEPCTMCAMALLHSRIHSVFYGCPTKYGAFGTLAKVHLLQGTNHRFDVYRGLLNKECSKLT